MLNYNYNAMIQCCVSGEEGFASIHCELYADQNYVVWRNFIDYLFSDKTSPKFHDYSGFGAFTFDRRAYEQSIRLAIEQLS